MRINKEDVMARYTTEGCDVMRDDCIFGRGYGYVGQPDEEVAEFIAAACNHYSAFLGSVAGLEEAGSHLTGQMELFSHET